MGKKAFMPGQIVHTNEILVLLGDNWFAERSAKQATQICQRRLDKCRDQLEKLKEEKKLVEGWKKGENRSEIKRMKLELQKCVNNMDLCKSVSGEKNI
jgi:hypothetical protein